MTHKKRHNFKPSKLIGPEDLRVGQYVTCADRTYEVLPASCDWPSHDRHIQPRCVTVTAHDADQPLRVEAVCLPFVLVRNPRGLLESIDLRQIRLARLSKAYGRAAFAST